MNQKRNQIVITDLKTWNWTRLLISRSPVRARQGALIKFDFEVKSDFFLLKKIHNPDDSAF
mgnify:CR=1 FL=1